MSPLDKVVSRLLWLLRLHVKGGVRARRMDYKSLPLVTDMKFEGIPLRSIMSPAVPSTGMETEQIFDSWLWPLTDRGAAEGGDPVQDLVAASSEDLWLFISKGKDFAEQTVRLLYALGNAEGATLDYGQRHILVHHGDRTYGVGPCNTVQSRFCSGLFLGSFTEPDEVLERVEDVRTFDKDFCSLYREAYRRGGGAVEALIALQIGQPRFNFRSMAESAAIPVPSKAKFRQWEAILAGGRDPVARLYKHLVPRWMSQGDFTRVVCPLSARSLEPSVETQQFYINRLHLHFDKNKDKQK